MALTHEDVTRILQIVEASRADEIVLELEDIRIAVHRDADASHSTVSADPQVRHGAATSPPSPIAAGRTAADIGHDPVHVTAPTVGTVQLRASPDEAPFVETGVTVETGQPLCLIGIMGEHVAVEAPTAGVIRIVSVADGTSVEYGQVLFVVDPGGSRG